MPKRLLLLVTLTLLFGSETVRAGTILPDSDCGGLRLGSTDCNYDSNAGLHWLDWTITTDISYSTMVAVELATGGDYEGFRYATLGEIDALLAGNTTSHTGLSPTQVINPGDVTLFELIQDLGPTRPGIQPDTDAFYVGGVGCPDPPECASRRQIDIAQLIETQGQSKTSTAPTALHVHSPRIGHALVAAAPGSAPLTPVPEPGTLGLMLIGLGFVRRWSV